MPLYFVSTLAKRRAPSPVRYDADCVQTTGAIVHGATAIQAPVQGETDKSLTVNKRLMVNFNISQRHFGRDSESPNLSKVDVPARSGRTEAAVTGARKFARVSGASAVLAGSIRATGG